MTEETTSDKMRSRMRTETEEERLQHREENINSARKNLKEIEEELKLRNVMTHEDLVAAVAKIKQSNQTSHLDLRALKQALHDSKTSVTFLRMSGSLSAIVGHLTGRKALHQLEAAYICCNLATCNEFACDCVANAAGPYLIGYLDCQNSALQVACLWTLGNLAGGSRKSFQILRSQGLIDRLTNCLNSSHLDVVEATIHALYFVLKMSMCEGQQTLELSSKEMEEIASSVVRLTCYRKEINWLLFLLSCKNDCDNIFLEKGIPEKCITELAEFSKNSPLQVDDLSILRSVTALIRTVANLCSGQNGKAALLILKHKSFLMVVNDFLHAKQTYIRQETLWLGMNIICHPLHEVVVRAHEEKLDKIIDAKDMEHVPIQLLMM